MMKIRWIIVLFCIPMCVVLAQSSGSLLGNQSVLSSTKGESFLRSSPFRHSHCIDTITNGSDVVLLEYVGSYWLVEIDSLRGFISDATINQSRATDKKKRADLKRNLMDEYGEYLSKIILSNQIMIGMNPRMVRLSVGEPGLINSQENLGTIYEEWIYNKRTLKFENGALISWKE